MLDQTRQVLKREPLSRAFSRVARQHLPIDSALRAQQLSGKTSRFLISVTPVPRRRVIDDRFNRNHVRTVYLKANPQPVWKQQ